MIRLFSNISDSAVTRIISESLSLKEYAKYSKNRISLTEHKSGADGPARPLTMI